MLLLFDLARCLCKSCVHATTRVLFTEILMQRYNRANTSVPLANGRKLVKRTLCFCLRDKCFHMRTSFRGWLEFYVRTTAKFDLQSFANIVTKLKKGWKSIKPSGKSRVFKPKDGSPPVKRLMLYLNTKKQRKKERKRKKQCKKKPRKKQRKKLRKKLQLQKKLRKWLQKKLGQQTEEASANCWNVYICVRFLRGLCRSLSWRPCQCHAERFDTEPPETIGDFDGMLYTFFVAAKRTGHKFEMVNSVCSCCLQYPIQRCRNRKPPAALDVPFF